MYAEDEDEISKEDLEERHNKLLSELQRMCGTLPAEYRHQITSSFVSNLANALLDKTVFDIVKNLREIQKMTEDHLLERRSKLVTSFQNARQITLKNHEEALRNEYKFHPWNAETLRQTQNQEVENASKAQDQELNMLDMEIIMELDQIVSDQQITLEKVGVPGFFVTNKKLDVQLQMKLLEFISELSAREGIV